MFTTHCPDCDTRWLIFPGQIKQLVNDEHGIVAIFTCWCGRLRSERLSTVAATRRVPEPIAGSTAHAA